MKGLWRQGSEMAALGQILGQIFKQGRHHPGAGGAHHRIDRPGEHLLKAGAPFAEAVKAPGIGQHSPEDQPLGRGQALVTGENGPGLEKDLLHADPAGAVGSAGAAEQAFVEPFIHPLGIVEHRFHQSAQEGQLAPGHIGLPAGLVE